MEVDEGLDELYSAAVALWILELIILLYDNDDEVRPLDEIAVFEILLHIDDEDDETDE